MALGPAWKARMSFTKALTTSIGRSSGFTGIAMDDARPAQTPWPSPAPVHWSSALAASADRGDHPLEIFRGPAIAEADLEGAAGGNGLMPIRRMSGIADVIVSRHTHTCPLWTRSEGDDSLLRCTSVARSRRYSARSRALYIKSLSAKIFW